MSSLVQKFFESRESSVKNLEPGEVSVLRQGAEMMTEMGIDMSRVLKQIDDGYLDNIMRDRVKEIISFMKDATGPDDDRWDDVRTLEYKLKHGQICN